MVKAGIITSSPGPMFNAFMAISKAAEPFETAIPNLVPTYFEKSSSNFLINGPSEDIHPVWIHSLKYFSSLPFNKGVLKHYQVCAFV